MSQHNSIGESQNLSSALYKTLLKRMPPNKPSPYLEDLVNAMIGALLKGGLEVDLSLNQPPDEIKEKGWPKAHKDALENSGWLDGESPPMVLVGNQLRWKRWHDDLEKVISGLIKRSTKEITTFQSQKKEIIPSINQELSQEQQNAVLAIETKSVILLSGGPGTGKTRTVISILERALWLNPNLKIGLTAPTGKATRRLKDTLHANLETLDHHNKESLSNASCKTLHSYLDAIPGGFNRNKKNPLPVDLLVIDEMSMVELALMKALLDALPENCQLVLVGDQNQLPPIGSGSIWHHLQKKDVIKQFTNSSIRLNKVYRNQGALASLTSLITEQPISSCWQFISNLPIESNIKSFICKPKVIPYLALKTIQEHYSKLKDLAQTINLNSSNSVDKHDLISRKKIDILKIFSLLEDLIVLCPRRSGHWGVNHLHRELLGNGFENDFKNWPEGTPIICGANQPELGLANGDIGILIGNGDNRQLIFQTFSESQNFIPVLIHPTRIRQIEPALAMTIHKAQGSEAKKVLLLWPDRTAPQNKKSALASQEEEYAKRLIYTALTRARISADLFLTPNSMNLPTE